MRVRRAVIEEMVAHARLEAPIECCGLLVGAGELIEECHRAVNVRSSAVTYQVDPQDHFAVIRRARAAGRSVIGAYHSHPASAAIPSDTDVREAYDSGLVYVIVSLADSRPDVRAYRISEGRAQHVPLVPVP
jgi:proteasome lid subunit RPN8/RPN11